MVRTGEPAPDFTAPLADGGYSSFTLSEAVGDGRIVLAFFPGAFSRGCTAEMSAFEDRLDAFQEADATVYGVSTDTVSALNAFRDELDLGFDLVSDNAKDAIHAYDVATDFDEIGATAVADRAVFVVDEDGTVVYRWVSDEAGDLPDYDTVLDEATRA